MLPIITKDVELFGYPPPLQFEHTTFHINVNKSNGAINDTKQSDSNTKNKRK